MGQKVNPYGFRLGVTTDWKSRWFATDKAYTDNLIEDFEARKGRKAENGLADIPCPNCGTKGRYTEPKAFSGLVKTYLGVVDDESGLHFLRPETERDPCGVSDAKARLDVSYGWLNERLMGWEWASGGNFTMADCAAAPSLFYADWVQPIDDRFAETKAYRARLLARPGGGQRCPRTQGFVQGVLGWMIERELRPGL